MAASCPSTSHSDASDQTMVVLFAAAHSSVNSISVLSALYASSTVVSIFLQKYIEMTVERMHSCYSFSSLSHPPSPSFLNFIWAAFSKKKKKKESSSLAPSSYLSSTFSLQMLSWAEWPQLLSAQTGQDTAQLSWTWLHENLWGYGLGM